MLNFFKYTAILLVLIVLISCNEDTQIDPVVVDDTFDHFPQVHYNNENNAYSLKRFELGKQLFFDPALSSDSTISCGTCHQQSASFADPGMTFSLGVNDSIGVRHTPTLVNMAWQPHFNWDGGVNHIEVFSFAPLTNPLEMNITIGEVLDRLNRSEYYLNKFYQAYQVDSITDLELFYALTNYMIELKSGNSKYDKVVRGESVFTQSEQAGYELFQSHCESCHKEPLMTSFEFKNNGLDSVFDDNGRYRITLDEADLGKFKIPTLRNIDVSYPYMHDGRFTSLEQVLDHYSNNILSSKTVDISLSLNFSDTEKAQIIEFLKTLTDDEFLSNQNLSL